MFLLLMLVNEPKRWISNIVITLVFTFALWGTFVMPPEMALITMCGGSRSSILLNIPGDGAAVASCFDGYPMTQQGRAEAANNTCSIGAMIPMFTLSVPGSGTTAVMLGALMIYGLQPGPLLFQNNPEIAWGVIASLFLANIICAIINIPLAGLLVRVLAVPPRVLYPLVIGMAFLGVYTINYSPAVFFRSA
jgi:TctA family transporter